MTMMTLSRRSFIRFSLGAAGTLCFPVLSRAARASALSGRDADPHFFFQIIFQGGMDPTYLFDARPLAMTQAGIIQNYLGEDPQEWAGTNGCRTLATRLVEPLKPYRDRFSVLNGVVMATGFDGHGQNMNFLMTGDPFGGESFVPHLNRLAAGTVPAPLDAITAGGLAADITNSGASVPLSADSAARLIGRLKKSSPLDPTNPLFAYVLGRMGASGAGGGAFAAGARQMQQAYAQVPGFAAMLLKSQLDQPGPQPSPSPTVPVQPQQGADLDPRFLQLSLELFRQGIVRSAVFVSNGNYDVHAAESAKDQPKTLGNAIDMVATLFKTLAQTQFDAHRSFLDVTTVMVASEFGRTLRQKDMPIDKTGTDHNPLTNSILLGGKGIVGGQIIGESDRRAAGEAVSKAHESFDPGALKMMGKPFDFKTGRPRTDLPEAYGPGDYLGMASVANTIYSMFGVPEKQYRKLVRNGDDAPLIPGLTART